MQPHVAHDRSHARFFSHGGERLTLAAVQTSPEKLRIGVALCEQKDQFSRRIGQEIALGRATHIDPNTRGQFIIDADADASWESILTAVLAQKNVSRKHLALARLAQTLVSRQRAGTA